MIVGKEPVVLLGTRKCADPQPWGKKPEQLAVGAGRGRDLFRERGGPFEEGGKRTVIVRPTESLGGGTRQGDGKEGWRGKGSSLWGRVSTPTSTWAAIKRGKKSTGKGTRVSRSEGMDT